MKTILITGANRGIGFETARQLALRGFHVFIGARSERQGQTALENLKQAGKVSLLVLDVNDSQSIATAAGKFAEIGRLDVLINNAGVFPDKGVSILTASRELMLGTLQTNTLGALETTQAFLPYLREAAPARVINLSSGYGQISGLSANAPSYCLSKLALDGVTIMLAEALKADRISVNAMCPGWVRTDMGGSSAPRSVAQGADTAVWLASEADPMLTAKMFRDRTEIPW